MEDWNALIKMVFSEYFVSDALLKKNKEILRTEIVNYVKFVNKKEFIDLFNWIYSVFKECILLDKSASVKMLSDSFNEIGDTDSRWMMNVLTQPDVSQFSERDKIAFYFKAMDEVLEGCFKPRFKLFDKFVAFKIRQVVADNSSVDFGKLINDFSSQFRVDADLLLKDPIASISISQWRNIAAHKSYAINKTDVVVKYGKPNQRSVTLSVEDFYKVFYWSQDVYTVIRLAEVLVYLNYMTEVVAELGGSDKIRVRFEASLLNLIHNMQIVGFEFVATEERSNLFCLVVKSKIGFNLQDSLFHASQCLDQLCCAVYDDDFVRDNYQKTKISVIDRETSKIASAIMSIETALEMVYGKIDLEQYLDKMEFEFPDQA
ncbi:hypothetical protein [Hymenobacter busanensis]|uniref:hypothetical protein n=1 Tax=Hymenobacter busanensis TaxID=2607656 RepID=UPI00191BE0C5|nr:hypothetical protein [Hymenobacter busanensis]